MAASTSVREWLEAGRFLWQASRGYRARPWRSPYLRWRIETYSGLPAESVDAAAFWSFVWRERRRLARYLRWTGAMRDGRRSPPTPRPPPAAR